MGLALYYLSLSGTWLVLGLQVKKRTWPTHPAFSAYLLFCGLRSLILWPVLYSHTLQLYSTLFWYLQTVSLLLLYGAVGEVHREKLAGWVTGASVVALVAALMLWTRYLMVNGEAGAYQASMAIITALRCADLFCAVLCAVQIRRTASVASGLFVATLFSAIVLGAQGPWRFAASAGWVVALFLWLETTLQPAAASRSET